MNYKIPCHSGPACRQAGLTRNPDPINTGLDAGSESGMTKRKRFVIQNKYNTFKANKKRRLGRFRGKAFAKFTNGNMSHSILGKLALIKSSQFVRQ